MHLIRAIAFSGQAIMEKEKIALKELSLIELR